jgi:signal peptidase II
VADDAKNETAFSFLGWVVALIVLADQAAKVWAVVYLKPRHTLEVIPGFFQFSYVENPGAAWGMLAGRQVFLIGFSIATLLFLTWKRRALFGSIPFGRWIFALLSAGILGNLIDRIRVNYVIDYLDFFHGSYHFPAFNIADSAICIATFSLLLFQTLDDLRKRR